MSQPRKSSLAISGGDVDRISADDAERYNIHAVRKIANAVRSTLGPKGLDKMLVGSTGDITITNDGVTILRNIDIESPTAKVAIEAAKTQEEVVGDGTTTVVVLAAEFLHGAEKLLDQGIHPMSIVRGYTRASEHTISVIDDIADPVDIDDEDVLRKVGETSMTGKMGEVNKKMFAELVVDVVREVAVKHEDGKVSVDLQNVVIKTQPGVRSAESELLDGAVLVVDPPEYDGRRANGTERILLIDRPINKTSEVELDATVTFDDGERVRELVDMEKQELRDVVGAIVDTGATVVVCQEEVDKLVQHSLAKEGVLVFQDIDEEDLLFLQNVLETNIVSNVGDINEESLGSADVEYDDTSGRLYFRATEGPGLTLLVRGKTEHVVDELKRNVEDALDSVTQSVNDGRVLYGGGATEVELSDRLMDFSRSERTRDQFAIQAFAEALEVLPATLAKNSGHDPIDVVTALRTAHDAGEHCAGLDVFTGEITDMLETGIVEPASGKAQAIATATETANMILKIGDILDAKGDGTES